MAGGGTGGHVIPSIAVAGELRRRGHEALFVGTRRGLEATLAPRADFPIEWIEIGGLQRVGWKQSLRTMWQLPGAVMRSWSLLRARKAAAIFSTGGYVAAPVMLAGGLCGTPIAVMEPNAMPGLVTRKLARLARKALLSFDETVRYFPPGRTEITGLPVRRAFFEIPGPSREGPFTLLVTGGSRGSRTLNRAARESWPLFRSAPFRLRFFLQSGSEEHYALASEFNQTGIEGEVVSFIEDMPAAYAEAHLIVSRAGAGAVAELAAAGKPSLLVPFPFAADDHQSHNAEAMRRAGAALVLKETEMNGQALFETVSRVLPAPETLSAMGRAARCLARPGAAERAAEVLEEIGRRR